MKTVHETIRIEAEQQKAYPGLRVRRDGDAVVVHIPMRFHRRNGRNMILTEGNAEAVPTRPTANRANQTLAEAIAPPPPTFAEATAGYGGPSLAGLSAEARRSFSGGGRRRKQLDSGEYASPDDLAQAAGVDRTYVGRMLRLTSLAPDIIEAILRGREPEGMSLEKLRKDLPVRWEEQRRRWG
ncbi:MAG: hypothetical protein GX591_18570 [Planctomycetes bacterium]|nr:hypothetical protein [Planctomycetota bacterium]